MSRLSPFPGRLVTVVVTVSDEGSVDVGSTLDSILEQGHRNLDVFVVAYGRADVVREVVRDRAARDWRMRMASTVAVDWRSARNAGAAGARGEFLTFVEGGDTLPPRAVGRLVASLVATESDFAFGLVTEELGVWADRHHKSLKGSAAERVQGATLADLPWAITDKLVDNRVFRRSFWRDAGLRFEPEADSEAGAALRAFVAAKKFDLLPAPVRHRRIRRGGAALGVFPDRLAALDQTLTQLHDSWRRVEGLGLHAVAASWLLAVIEDTVAPLLESVETATDDTFETLREGVAPLLRAAEAIAPTGLTAESRVKFWLLENRHRTELEEFVASRWYARGQMPTEARDGKILAHLPYFEDPAVGVPTECFELAETETPLVVILHRAAWSESGKIVLDVWARIRFLGMQSFPTVAAKLCHPTGAELAVTVEHRRDERANLVRGAAHQDYSYGAMRLVIDPAQLAELAVAGDEEQDWDWHLEMDLTAEGVTRTGGLTALSSESSFGADGRCVVPARQVSGVMVGVSGSHQWVAAIRARRRAVTRLVALELRDRHVTVTLDPEDHEPTELRVRAGSQDLRSPLSATDDGLVEATLTLPTLLAEPRETPWEVTVVRVGGSELPILWPQDAVPWINPARSTVAGHRSPEGMLRLVEASNVLVVDRIDLVDGNVQVTGSWLGPAPDSTQVTLIGDSAVIEGRAESASEHGVSVVFVMQHDVWGLGSSPVPVGSYALRLTCETGGETRDGRVLGSGALVESLMDGQVDATYRLGLMRHPKEIGISLSPPLTAAERGPLAKQALIDWTRSGEIPLDPSAVYFQSYAGGSATDSPLAIHEELRRRNADLRSYWGVADRSARVPEGAIPVILGSHEHHRILGSAGHLVVNVDFERWFERHPGQRVLQTFHGYPAKSMGIGLWRAKGYSPLRIAAERQRTVGDWDLILTPSPEMDEHYRREYDYPGPIHNRGYPRDDVLVSEDAPRIRDLVRTRLGVAPDQRVVLYAPTWRDDLATTWNSAQLVDHLDLDVASRQLGPDYVLLIRGHRFHQRGDERHGEGARLLDVSDYPEVNDLILASDTAVLDYSSLRFDFALTGKPMVFLVPDLATYSTGARGFLFDFAASAPGPCVDTSDEAVSLLSDLSSLSAHWSGVIAEFNERFNRFQDGGAAARVVDAFFER